MGGDERVGGRFLSLDRHCLRQAEMLVHELERKVYRRHTSSNEDNLP